MRFSPILFCIAGPAGFLSALLSWAFGAGVAGIAVTWLLAGFLTVSLPLFAHLWRRIHSKGGTLPPSGISQRS
ncbi:hypothetical protein [Pseudogemmobacter bohemicus]|uniref:hypothetical protein n=1 Tax=Pseudogemmobacter bohemicus TaxID=2250708 RepID=UPI000DD3792E|nr:hypothetical protein [Pseudogemmobacter bohemicus]